MYAGVPSTDPAMVSWLVTAARPRALPPQRSQRHGSLLLPGMEPEARKDRREDLQRVAKKYLTKEGTSVLHYPVPAATNPPAEQPPAARPSKQ